MVMDRSGLALNLHHASSAVQIQFTGSTGLCARVPLRWRQNRHAGGSNHQPHHCLLNHLFGCRSKKTPKLRVTGLCAGNSPGPGTGEFPTQIASNAENVSIWWRHHDISIPHVPIELGAVFWQMVQWWGSLNLCFIQRWFYLSAVKKHSNQKNNNKASKEHLVVCSLTMKHTRVVSTKCTPGFAPVVHLMTPLSCVSLSMNTQPSVPTINILLKNFHAEFMYFPWPWHGTHSWNSSSWKARTRFPFLVNIMAPDDLNT